MNAVPRHRERQSTEPCQVFTIAWNRVHVALESPFAFPRNPCSPSRGIRTPTISGAPVTTARVGQPYAFKPNASDADGDALTYSVSGKPAWATFDTSTGTLYGTPASGDVGLHSNVVIAVSDGKATARLAPFAITVSTGTTQSVTLNWTAPTTNTDGSALTDLAGYVVSFGTASRQYQA